MNDDWIGLAALNGFRLTPEEVTKIAAALEEVSRRVEAELQTFSDFLIDFQDDAPTPRPQPHTMRDALAANARPVHRPQPQRRIQRRQHR